MRSRFHGPFDDLHDSFGWFVRGGKVPGVKVLGLGVTGLFGELEVIGRVVGHGDAGRGIVAFQEESRNNRRWR